jgi:hypothetical protein
MDDLLDLKGKEDKKNYYGLITCSKSVFLDEKVLSNARGENTAVFSIIPMSINNIIGSAYLDAGEVLINGINLKKIKDEGTIYYNDTINKILEAPYKYSVSGNGSVPSINYNFNADFPTYTGYESLPDTINLNGHNIILLTGITDADEVEVYISDRLNSSKIKIVSSRKFNSPGIEKISFTPDDLSSLNKEIGGTIEVFCFRCSYLLVNKKYYKFQTGYHLQKLNVVFK